MPPIDSQKLREVMTIAAERKIPADVLLQQLNKRGFEVHPDTVRRVKEHYRTAKPKGLGATSAPAESTGAAPADSGVAPTLPSPEQIATARAVETMGTGDSTVQTAVNPTPGQEMAAAGKAAAEAIPGTMAVAANLIAPELGPIKGTVATASKFLNKVPVVGKALAGITKGVPGVAGATLGGGTGSILEDLVQGHEIDTEGILQNATEQGLLAVGGGTLANLTGGAGKMMLKGALPGASEKAFATQIAEDIPVTGLGRDRLRAKLGDAGLNTKKITETYSKKGVRHSPTEIARGAWKDVANEIGTGPEAEPQFRTLAIKMLQFLKQHGGNVPNVRRAVWAMEKHKGSLTPDQMFNVLKRYEIDMTPTQLLALKQDADAVAKPIYVKMAKKEPITARDLVRVKWAQALANRSRNQLNLIDYDPLLRTSPIMEANRVTSGLAELNEAMNPVVNNAPSPLDILVNRGRPALVGGAIGGAVTPGGLSDRGRGAAIGATTGALLGTPAVSSQLGLLFNNPHLLDFLRFAPQTFRTLGDMAVPDEER